MSREQQIQEMHRMQAEHSASVRNDAQYVAKASAWIDPRTTDYWRHDRMRQPILPLMASREKWLTVGDGRYGADANWLIIRGQDVLCTDIQDDTLVEAHQRNLINNYCAANAESLQFEDNSFDWALCKESYHHMPRAPLAFYELLRVTRKGIVMIEPVDTEAKRWWGRFTLPIFNAIKSRGHGYEPSGNYVYTLSRVEVEKMMLGIGLRHYAFMDLSDCLIAGTEYEFSPGPILSKIKRNIAFRNLVKNVFGISAQIGVFVIFHDERFIPDEIGMNGLRVYHLPGNPYLPT